MTDASGPGSEGVDPASGDIAASEDSEGMAAIDGNDT